VSGAEITASVAAANTAPTQSNNALEYTLAFRTIIHWQYKSYHNDSVKITEVVET